MKDAIIKEIRKDDSKVAKSAPKENADANGKKKRIRINKEKVDVNNVASNFTHPTPNSQKPAGHGGQGGGQNRNRNNNKDRFKKPVVKQEVSEEDVAKQVKETLARLTTKGKTRLPNTVRKNGRWFPTVCRNWKTRRWKKAKC